MFKLTASRKTPCIALICKTHANIASLLWQTNKGFLEFMERVQDAPQLLTQNCFGQMSRLASLYTVNTEDLVLQFIFVAVSTH